jgi:phosphoribosyl-AMP cyclohydrolase
VSNAPENLFGNRVTVEQVEEGHDLAPKFDAAGLIPCVTTDFRSGEVLMVAVMNREALSRTIETGEAHYWSRSRQQLWHKGATSGLVQTVVEMRIDAEIGTRSRLMRPTCSMIPVPAGTNSKDRLVKNPSATLPSSSGMPPLITSPMNKIAIPSTGPGSGALTAVTINSPANWQHTSNVT